MKKLLIGLAIFISIVFLGITGLYFYINNQFKKDLFPRIKETINKELDIEIDFEDIDLSFAALLKLKPTLVIKKLRIAEAIYVDNFKTELALKELFNKKVLIKKIIISKSTLKFEENSKREVFPKGINITELAEKLEKRKEKDKKKKDEILFSEIKLKELEIKDSIYEFTPYKAKSPIKLSNLNVKLTDFVIADDQDVIAKLKLDAEFFDVKSSNITCDADLGPIDMKFSKMPINGQMSINLKIKDLPRDIKDQFLGTVVKTTSGSSFRYDSSLKGDLFGVMSGSGQLKINDLVMGNTDEYTMTLNSNIPLAFTIDLFKNLYLNARSSNATFALKDKNSKTSTLSLNFNTSVNLESMYMKGNASGSMTDLDIEEALNCFTDTRNVVSGIFELKNYQVSFAGIDAKQISDNLTASGHIKICDGSLYILKNITKYKDYVGAVVQNGDELTEKIAGEFANLETDFHLANNQLSTSNLLITSSVATISGAGKVIGGKSLDYQVVLNAEKLSTPIPMTIRGTIQKPKIYPDVNALLKLNQGKIVKTALQQGLNLLQKEANKNSKLGNILGKVQSTLNNGQAQNSTTVNGATSNGSTATQPLKIKVNDLGTALKGIAREAIQQKLPPRTTTNGTTAAPATSPTTTSP